MAGAVRDRNRKWWILAAMTLALTLISVDQGIAPVTLSRIQREMGISGLTLFWVINAYLLAFTVMAAAGGRLGDILGVLSKWGNGVWAICSHFPSSKSTPTERGP